MPESVWVPLIFAGVGTFFLVLDLSAGVTRLVFWSVSRDSQPHLFWISEAGNILLIVGGLLFATYGAWRDLLPPHLG